MLHVEVAGDVRFVQVTAGLATRVFLKIAGLLADIDEFLDSVLGEIVGASPLIIMP
jgi:hypothetical protein